LAVSATIADAITVTVTGPTSLSVPLFAVSERQDCRGGTRVRVGAVNVAFAEAAFVSVTSVPAVCARDTSAAERGD
jgi:hypothetical protein